MSFSKTTTLLGALLLVGKVAAHGTVSGIVADGIYYQGYSPSMQYANPQPNIIGWSVPEDLSNGFIDPNNCTSPNIICHLGATPAPISASVKAGGTVELQWTPWPSSHHGPVIDYLANCNGPCSSVEKTSLEFTKIDGIGLVDDTNVPGNWATDKLIAANNSWTVTIPESIAPGEKLYTPTDPGILIDIYTALSSYVVPGPAPLSGASSGTPPASSAPISSVSVATATTVPSSPASVPAPSAPASSSMTAPAPSAPATTTAPVINAPSPTAITTIATSSSAAIPTAVPSSPISGGNATQIPDQLPAGVTLKELLQWLEIVLKDLLKSENQNQKRSHSRAF